MSDETSRTAVQGGIPPVSLVAVVVALVPLLVKRKLAHDKKARVERTTGNEE